MESQEIIQDKLREQPTTLIPETDELPIQPNFSKLQIIFLIITTIFILGTLYFYFSKRASNKLSIIPSPSPIQTYVTTPIPPTSTNISSNSSVTSEKCPTYPIGSYSTEVTIENEKCKFTMFDGYDSTKRYFTILYPQKWQVSVVGATAANLRFDKNDKENVLMLNSTTDLPLESLNKAQYCYEGCMPIIDIQEKEISRTIKSFGTLKVLEISTSLNNQQIQRYFYLTDQKYDNKFSLFVFEFTPTTKEFDNEVVELIKSMEFPIK